MSLKPFKSLVAGVGVSLILSAGAAVPASAIFGDTWSIPIALTIACKWEPAGLTAAQKSALERYCSAGNLREFMAQFPEGEEGEDFQQWFKDVTPTVETVLRDYYILTLVHGDITPGNSDITVRGYGFEPGEPVTLEVVDADGQVVQTFEMGVAEDDFTFEGSFTFDTSLPTGVYEVRLINDRNTAVGEFEWDASQPAVTPTPTPTPTEEVPGSSPSPTPTPTEDTPSPAPTTEVPSPAPTPADESPSASPTPTPTEDTPSPTPTTEAPSPEPTPADESPSASSAPTTTQEAPSPASTPQSPSSVPGVEAPVRGDRVVELVMSPQRFRAGDAVNLSAQCFASGERVVLSMYDKDTRARVWEYDMGRADDAGAISRDVVLRHDVAFGSYWLIAAGEDSGCEAVAEMWWGSPDGEDGSGDGVVEPGRASSGDDAGVGPVSDAARTLADTGGAGLIGVIVAGAALAGGVVMLRRR